MKPIVHTGKRTIASIILAFGLTSVPAHAGLPVIDWTGILTAIKQTAQDATMWGTEFAKWEQQFNELKRGIISSVSDLKANPNIGTWTKEDYAKHIQVTKDNCTKIKDLKSQQLCTEMADVKLEKNELFFESFDKLNAELKEFKRRIDERAATSSDKNSGQVQAKEQAVIMQGQRIDQLTKMYDLKLKQLDAKYDLMQEIRVERANQQMSGTDLGNSLAKVGVSTVLNLAAQNWQEKIEEQRAISKKISNRDITKASKATN